MMKYLYNALLFCWALCILPRTLYQYIIEGKYRGNLLSRLGLCLPNIQSKLRQKRIWIHATSLGETRAVGPFIQQIRSDFPEAHIIFSSTTETGQKEAREKQKEIDTYFFLPLDLSWLMKKLVQRISPDLFILVESDFWYNMLREIKDSGAKIALVNGRMSLSSFKNYRRFPSFSQRLFGLIDLYCVQNEEYRERFMQLGVPSYRAVITGNLKFDVKEMLPTSTEWNFPEDRPMITLASTHEKEEEMLLTSLSQVDSSIVFLLAPRHPERFDRVAKWLQNNKILFRKIREESVPGERVVLIDTIGLLDECFKRSKLAIVGGSFVSHVGGHNVYEPVKYQIPVLYGPHMQKQRELADLLERYEIGKAVELSDLYNTVNRSLEDVKDQSKFTELKGSVEGATFRSWEKIKEL